MIQYKISWRCVFRITVGFAALIFMLLMSGAGAIINNEGCNAINNSYTTPCAEFDNVDIPLFGNVTSFVIEATHPTYNVGGDYSCATNFTNCPNPGDPTYPDYPDYPFPPNTYTLFDDGETVIQAVREALWWQPHGMNASVNSNTPVTDIHSIRVSRKIVGDNEWPQFFVLYSDGNARLIPHPPVESTSVCFASSVIIGPATIAERPIADISSVRYISSSKTMEVIYRDGGSAILDLNEVNRSMARVKVTVNFPTDLLPFATFRSMYVSDGNADVDHVRWQDASGEIHNEGIMGFQGAEGSNWLFYRSNWSKHNPSGPDIAIKDFIFSNPTVLTAINVVPGIAEVASGSNTQFNATGLDQNNNIVIFTPFWHSANTSVGTINSNTGLFTAIKAGTVAIQAFNTTEGGTPYGAATVIVVAGNLSNITVLPITPAVQVNETLVFTAKGTDAGGNAVAITPVWSSSDASVGMINASTGVFKAIAPGTTWVNATALNLTGSTAVIVAQTPNGTINGMVSNVSSGLAISGATVTADGVIATTNALGRYEMSIAPGTYNVTAGATGFVSNTTNITVTSGAAVTQNFSLSLREIIEDPEVKAYDDNHNGIIEKNEALRAVRDYFDGLIQKAQALKVVRAYFS